MGRGGPALGAAWALAVLCPVPALVAQTQTTFYAAFADGQEAFRQGQYRTAMAALERAVQLRPVPAARVIIYGNNLLLDYYPYSLVARCHLELGEPEQASAWLRQAEAEGEPASVRGPVARRLVLHGQPAPAPMPVAQPDQVPAVPTHPETPAPAAPLAQPDQAGHAPGPIAPTGAQVPAQASTLPELQQLPGPEAAAPGAGGATHPPLPEQRPDTAKPNLDAPGTDSSPERGARQGPDPLRPLGPTFWVLFAGGLAALALRQGLNRWRRRRGAPAAKAPAPLPPDPGVVGPYLIVRPLGQGGFATTYLARHRDTGREVALKVLHPHRRHDPDFRQRFIQEARLGALLDHPNLVRLLDPGDPADPGWIALEYVPGPTLEAHLKAQGPLPLAEAVAIATGIAEAMAYAHARGVVHRDLKPANVILSRQGPRVMDLGIARDMADAGLTTTYAFMGTPLYAAPEAQLLLKAGPAADRYGLGVILFEMVAGRPPFLGETPFAIMDQHRSAPVPDLLALRPVPLALARFLERLLEKDPNLRPEDGELVAWLERFALTLAEVPAPVPDRR